MWFKIEKQQVRISILAKPNARKTALLGVSEQRLLIALRARPQQGEANQELVEFLAELLRLPKTKVVLQKGQGARYKQVVVPLTDEINRIINQLEKMNELNN